MWRYLLVMFAATFFTAISQVLLKQSADRHYSSPLREYLNVRVLLAYAVFFGVLLLNTYAFTKVDMKYGAVIDTVSYAFVMILSRAVLGEKFSKGKLLGNLLILAGVFVYML